MDLCTVQLKDFRVFAYHGVHKEERMVGTNFSIDLAVSYPMHEPIERLEQTIDYVQLSEWVRQKMSTPTALLETVAQVICATIKEHYPVVTEINITITKLSPPVVNFQGSLGVTIIKRYL